MEIIRDHFQNFKQYGIPNAQLIIANIPYNIGKNAYGSNPAWYIDGDNANGESPLAGKEFFEAPGCIIAHDLEYAIEMVRDGGEYECFIIGGAEIYKQAFPKCKRLYVTNVRGVFDGDAFLPPLGSGWSLVCEECHEADEKNCYAHRFSIFERI